MKEFCPPNEPCFDAWESLTSVFLAGSIEMNRAEDWQSWFIDQFKDDQVMFLNPRRPDWNSTIDQSIDDPEFVEQVDWELDHLDMADFVVMYLQPGTVSPISLLELGILAESKCDHIIVCCPDGFHRKGNVDIVCDRYGIQTVDTLEQLVAALRERI